MDEKLILRYMFRIPLLQLEVLPSCCSVFSFDKNKKGGRAVKKTLKMFRESMAELKSVQTLAVIAMLTALTAILGFYTIVIGDFIKIGFSFIAKGIAGMLFGPACAGILGGISDLINYIIKPTGAFFPGFTFNAILAGVIYGIGLYKKPISIKRIFATKLTIVIIVDLLLSTAWLSMMYGKAFMVLLPMRTVKALIMLPIETAMLYFMSTRVNVIFKLGLKGSTEAAGTKSA